MFKSEVYDLLKSGRNKMLIKSQKCIPIKSFDVCEDESWKWLIVMMQIKKLSEDDQGGHSI